VIERVQAHGFSPNDRGTGSLSSGLQYTPRQYLAFCDRGSDTGTAGTPVFSRLYHVQPENYQNNFEGSGTVPGLQDF
jgi:hypothetical protein